MEEDISMQTIIKKAVLMNLPPPPFCGTQMDISIEMPGDEFGIYRLVPDSGQTGDIDWGDGCIEHMAKTGGCVHRYLSSGDYTVSISDHFTAIGFSSRTASDFKNVYAPKIRSVFSNAAHLVKLEQGAFSNAVNLASVDIADIACTEIPVQCFRDCKSLLSLDGLPLRATSIAMRSFDSCIMLKGDVNLPGIENIIGTSGNNPPFLGCNSITIHFAAANELKIRQSPVFENAPTLGAEDATVVFDL